ncbi:beta-ketoacyl synthase N-terminal-like domain-containing protein [Paenibacillus thiaminolyticus]|uniref:type I polyketide synthase n=1 Tax=Paenibacillus thiaminolyticus TaxID=49283 RepID=UPI0035A6763C
MNNAVEEQEEVLEGIAIIGLAGRFPGGRSVDQFWEDLLAGREMISFFTEEELTESNISRSLLDDPKYVRAAGYLDGFEQFDAAFFKMTNMDAETTDPQHRLFLEVAWEALENAGYDPETFDGRIGVYGGAGTNNYRERITGNPQLSDKFNGLQVMTGNAPDMLATQVAYKLNLKGPSMTVQTACSTSLVAVHQACQSLNLYESDVMLAGGVSIRSLQKEGYLYQEGSILSPDGHCRPFDAAAKGTVPSDGACIVVLKRYRDAVRDGDTIYAVIRGSAVNNDGSLKTGFTAPSIDGQVQVIADALAIADAEPGTIQYIETHGTGTSLGDPIEMQALNIAYHTDDEVPKRRIGSVKSNIGHLDTAAGVASLIKTALSLKHNQIPPTLHFQEGNPEIDWSLSRCEVNDRVSAYDRDQGPARAAVSSFGIGGTNAHVILQEAVEAPAQTADRGPQLLVLSACTESALRHAAGKLAEDLPHKQAIPLADIAYTLQAGRRAFANRLAVVANDHEQAAEVLTSRSDSRRVSIGQVNGESAPLVFLFPGQGAQYVYMARELYDTETLFRETFDRCAEQIRRETGTDLRSLVYPQAGEEEHARELLNQTQWTQPAVFAIEYALAKLLISFGLQPSAMIGHSIGEYVAAVLSGVMRAEDALSLIIKRAALMQKLPAGGMLAVGLSEREVRPLLADGLSIAAVNGPEACVVAGHEEAIAELHNRLREREVAATRLNTSHAFHSAMMDPILPQFAELARGLMFGTPQIPYLSNVSGTWITAEQATDPAYYVKHLREAVRFAEGVSALLEGGNAPLFLEVGPGNVLTTLVHQQAKRDERPVTGVFSSLRHRNDPISDVTHLLHVIGQLWVHGARMDWNGLHGGTPRRRVPLPTYPFERKPYLLPVPEQSHSHIAPARKDADHWQYLPSWQRTAPVTALKQKTDALGTILIFADRHGCGEAVSQALRHQGRRAILVQDGNAFASVDEDVYMLDAADKHSYAALFHELKQSDRFPTHVLHAWSVGTPTSYAESQHRGFSSIIRLAQAYIESEGELPLNILALTSELEDVLGDTVQASERATLYGALRVIQQENPLFRTRALDIRLHEASASAEHLAQELLTDDDSFKMAYRGAMRFVETFVPIRVNTPSTAVLREGGFYLITGAAQPYGRAYAEHLAGSCNARLLLLDAADSESAEHLSHLGRFVTIDLMDAEAIRCTLITTAEEWGPVRGVIHAANRREEDLIPMHMPEPLEQTVSANVLSTLALQAALEGQELDFFLLHNTLIAQVGGIGQVDTCASAAFRDAFAHAARAAGMPALSVNWTHWQPDTWKTQTMENMPELQEKLRDLHLTIGITQEEAMQQLESILHSGLVQTIVAPVSLERILEEQHALAALSFSRTRGEGIPSPPTNAVYDDAPANEAEEKVASIWQEMMGLERIGIHDDFFMLGGNSLLAIQIIARMRTMFGVEVPMTAIFESPTISGLAEAVMALQLEQVNEEELDSLLDEIEGLSDEEIALLLGV